MADARRAAPSAVAFLGTLVGKAVVALTWFRPDGGHALPGLVVNRLFPGYLIAMIRQLPEGVAVVTGTNGKTTTTKMVVELLRADGKGVVTNPTGSNLGRGVVSDLVRRADWRGALTDDVAVLEVDEAYLVRLVAQVRPRWILALNVSRDQLDRYGEVDTVANLIGTAMRTAADGVVTNADDPRLRRLGREVAAQGVAVDYFGVTPALAPYFPTDDELVSVGTRGDATGEGRPAPSVELVAFEGRTASYRIDGQTYRTELQVTGQHNFANAAAALALVRHLVPTAGDPTLVRRVGEVGVAFGRGETFTLRDGSEVQLVLAKNPASFRQAIASYLGDQPVVMVVINDNIPDGRDVSWLWDVDVAGIGPAVEVTSGTRGADMALRLGYADVDVRAVVPDVDVALERFCTLPGRKVVIANYTAMLHLYAELRRRAGVSL